MRLIAHFLLLLLTTNILWADSTAVTQRIKHRVINSQEISRQSKDIEVVVSPGSVTLEGEVESRQDIYTLENIVKQEAWDRSIQNNLTVRPYQDRAFYRLFE
jgi:osmotically-inducible protein OsmY